MTTESHPTLASVILEPVYLHPVDLVDANSQPVLDETGNPIRDEEGRIIYG